jgi:hypothetical protein
MSNKNVHVDINGTPVEAGVVRVLRSTTINYTESGKTNAWDYNKNKERAHKI